MQNSLKRLRILCSICLIADFCGEDFQTFYDMRQILSKQKEQIKILKREINDYCSDIENLRSNFDKLIKQNEELLRKNGSLQKQGKMLLIGRRNLLRRLQNAEDNNLDMQKTLDTYKDSELNLVKVNFGYNFHILSQQL